MAPTKSSLGIILKAFFVSSVGTGLSRILGAVRDVVIAHYFGASKVSDAFWMAWTIPSVFRRFVADEGLTGALIPALSQEESKNGRSAARNLTDTIFTFLMLVLFVFCIGGIIGAPYLVRIFASGYTKYPETFALTIRLTKWLFPFVAMVSLVSFCEGILNYRNHFFIPKIAPGLVNLGMIVCVILFYHSFKPPIFSLVAGVLTGGIIHFLIQIFPLKKFWYLPRFRFSFKNPRLKFFLGEMGKVILIGLFAQLNIVVLRNLASFLTPGSMTHYQNANRIMDLTQGMIAVGMASAIMPALAKSVANEKWVEMRDQLEYSFRVVAFFLFPAAVFICFFNMPIVSLLYCHGKFTFQDSQVTAITLQFLIPFLLNVAAINILKKVYFAFDDRNTLLFIGGFGVLLTASIGWLLINKIGVKGLAVALSVSSFVQLVLYMYMLNKKIRNILHFKKILYSWITLLVACVPFSVFLFFIINFGQWELGIGYFSNVAIFIASGIFSITSYFTMAYFLRLSEVQIVFNLFRKKK